MNGLEEIEDENDYSCFGEYSSTSKCLNCSLRYRCKRFTEAERVVAIRYKGKYKGRGKERKRDKY